jgi:hypothetical protein
MISLAYDAYIDKVASKFSIVDKGAFLKVPLLTEELLKHTREALKQEIKAF